MRNTTLTRFNVLLSYEISLKYCNKPTSLEVQIRRIFLSQYLARNLLVSLDFYFKCCEGHVVRRVGGDHAKCCGVHTYDSRFFFCYQRLIYPLCRKLTYNPRTQKCCTGVVNPRTGGDHSSCCYTKSYDGRVNFCYEKKVYGKCQSKSYNPHSYICCENKIRPHVGGKDTKCCKDKSYDSGRLVTTLRELSNRSLYNCLKLFKPIK